MKPSEFKQSNKTLFKPKLMSDEVCSSLPVYITDDGQCISLWNTSFWNRLKFLFHGKLWIGILSGPTQPPMWVDLTKTIFKK